MCDVTWILFRTWRNSILNLIVLYMKFVIMISKNIVIHFHQLWYTIKTTNSDINSDSLIIIMMFLIYKVFLNDPLTDWAKKLMTYWVKSIFVNDFMSNLMIIHAKWQKMFSKSVMTNLLLMHYRSPKLLLFQLSLWLQWNNALLQAEAIHIYFKV